MNRPKSVALVDISYLFKKNYSTLPGAPPLEAAKKTLSDLTALSDGVAHLIICRDAPPYRRADRFPAYKAKRPAPEPEEKAQRRWLFEQLQARGYQMAWCQGYEADDVIATLAKAYGQWCDDIRIVTSDKDAAQCVDAVVTQYIPPVGEKDWEVRDVKGVTEKFGVAPSQMPLWQALQGDASDNIPGIKGIGKVTATELVQWFGGAAGIIGAVGAKDARIKPATAKKLADGWNDLQLYIELVTLDTAVPLDPEALLEPLEPTVPQRQATLDVELTGFMGNETPAPTTPENDVAYEKAVEKYEERQTPLPPPRIGKDPQAEAILAKAAADRAKLAEFERMTAAQNTNAPKTEERIAETQAFIAAGNAAERLRLAERERQQAQLEQQYDRQRVAEAEYDAVSNAPGDKAAEPVQQAKLAPMPASPIKPGLAKTTAEPIAVAKTPPDYGRVDENLQPLDLRSAEMLSKWLASGDMYPHFKTPAQIFTVISRSRELGIGMHAGLSATHMIEVPGGGNKPANHADLIRALAERDPNCEYLMPVELTDTYAIWEGKHRKHPKAFQYKYTIEEAKEAGLVKASAYGKPGNWMLRARDMLSKTAGSKLARLLWPGATLGLYCPEETTGQTMEELQRDREAA